MNHRIKATSERDALVAEISRLRRRTRELEAEVEHMADVVARSAELFVELEEAHEREEDFRRADEELRLTHAVDQVLQSAWSVESLLAGLLDLLVSYKPLGARAHALAYLCDENSQFVRVDARGQPPAWFCERAMQIAHQLRGPDVARTPDNDVLAIGLTARGRLLGALCVETAERDARRWRDRWRPPLTTIGALVGMTIDRIRAEERLREMYSDLEQAREQALVAGRSKDAFLANMNHELRTPLNIIVGYSELLLESAEDDENDGADGNDGNDGADANDISEATRLSDEGAAAATRALSATARRDLHNINTASQDLLRLISQLLDLSRLESGDVRPFFTYVIVELLGREVTDLLQREFAARGNNLRVHIQPRLGQLWTDANKLSQVLYNILGNANKFTSHGLIDFRVARVRREGEDFIQFEIQDTGIGMTAAQMRQIFQPFVQADDSPSREYQGPGIGLATSKRLCEILGGVIEVESEFGVGSVFRVLLPAEPLAGG